MRKKFDYVNIPWTDPLGVLEGCGGYYHSRKDNNGNYIGPLVGYAGTYKDEQEKDQHYVGFEYFNFSKAESDNRVRRYFASLIDINSFSRSEDSCDVFLGAPMGGIQLATTLGGLKSHFYSGGLMDAQRSIFAEKKDGKIVIDRHDIDPGDRVVIVEDVCNNFSTTEKIKAEIEKQGGKLVGIACAFNRSGLEEWHGLPVISAHVIPTKQYKQDDPLVAQLIADGKIVWHPKLKPNWKKLLKAMGK